MGVDAATGAAQDHKPNPADRDPESGCTGVSTARCEATAVKTAACGTTELSKLRIGSPLQAQAVRESRRSRAVPAFVT